MRSIESASITDEDAGWCPRARRSRVAFRLSTWNKLLIHNTVRQERIRVSAARPALLVSPRARTAADPRNDFSVCSAAARRARERERERMPHSRRSNRTTLRRGPSLCIRINYRSYTDCRRVVHDPSAPAQSVKVQTWPALRRRWPPVTRLPCAS